MSSIDPTRAPTEVLRRRPDDRVATPARAPARSHHAGRRRGGLARTRALIGLGLGLILACSIEPEVITIDLDLLDDPSCDALFPDRVASVSVEVLGVDEFGRCQLGYFCTSTGGVGTVAAVEAALRGKQPPLVEADYQLVQQIFVGGYETLGCLPSSRILCAQEFLNQAVDGHLPLQTACTTAENPEVCEFTEFRPCQIDPLDPDAGGSAPEDPH